MILDQSVQNYTLFVGTFDVTPYLTAFKISIPNSEINALYKWGGDFSLFVTDEAYQNGLSENDFSELVNPSRWREGQQQVILTINGYQFPILRIKDFTLLNRTGNGTLTQLSDLLWFDRLPQYIDATSFCGGVALEDVLRNLIYTAGTIEIDALTPPTTVQILAENQINVPTNLVGSIVTKLVSTNPMESAQKLAASNWCWLTVDNEENINVIPRSVSNGVTTAILNRSADLVDIQPQNNNIHFAADAVIVTCSRQHLPPQSSSLTVYDAGEAPIYNAHGQLLQARTESNEPVGSIFPQYRPADNTPITSEVKTVFYRYEDDLNISIVPTNYLNWSEDVQVALNDFPIYTGDTQGLSGVVQTVTVTETIIGKVFQDDPPDPATVPPLNTVPVTIIPTYNPLLISGTPSTSPSTVVSDAIPERLLAWMVSSVQIESQTGKYSFVPMGVKHPDATLTLIQKLPLVLDKQEKIKHKPLSPNHAVPGVKNPLTGNALKLEPRVKKQKFQAAPVLQYETQVLTGRCDLAPNGWNTFIPKVYKEDIGFVPDESLPNILATNIALREIARRDAKLVYMEVPIEWAALGFPYFSIFNIDVYQFLVENPIIVMSGKKMIFSFTGELMGTIPQVQQALPLAPYIPTTGINVYATNNISGTVGTPVRSQIMAIGGTPPYTFSATGLPAGLSINSTTGVISGTPTTANV